MGRHCQHLLPAPAQESRAQRDKLASRRSCRLWAGPSWLLTTCGKGAGLRARALQGLPPSGYSCVLATPSELERAYRPLLQVECPFGLTPLLLAALWRSSS